MYPNIFFLVDEWLSLMHLRISKFTDRKSYRGQTSIRRHHENADFGVKLQMIIVLIMVAVFLVNMYSLRFLFTEIT